MCIGCGLTRIRNLLGLQVLVLLFLGLGTSLGLGYIFVTRSETY